MVNIKGNHLSVTITNKGLVLEVKCNRYDEDLYNFEMMATIYKGHASFNFDPYLDFNVNDTLKKLGYFSRMDVGQRAQRWTSFSMA